MTSALRLPEKIGRTILELRAEELRLKREARQGDTGKNIASAVPDVSILPDWEPELIEVSPRNAIYSHLRAFWYRAQQRWVLYDVLPFACLDDELDTGSGLTGAELKAIMRGPRPSDCTVDPGISDAQHEMGRLWGGFARPFWVLQGENGGHQVRFSPIQATALVRMGLPSEPPAVGSLPPCPWDNRVVGQLRHLNRLHQLNDSIDQLRRSGSPEAAAAEMARIERDVRDAEMAFIEAQVRPLVEMSSSLVSGPNARSEWDSEIVRMAPGTAAKAADAYQEYRDTGRFTY